MQPIVAEASLPPATSEDAALLTELHEADGARLYDFARHLGLTDEQAADALQEAFFRLWRELQRGTVIESPTAWTFRTLYRLAMEQHRLRRRLALLLPRIAPRRADYAGPESSDRLAVWTAVDTLPARQRHVLYLHYASDLAFEDVARVLGISASAARTHASRGLATLRRELRVEEGS